MGSETPLLRVSSTGYQTFAGPLGPFPSCEAYRNYANYIASMTADPEGGTWFNMAEATGLGPSPRGVGHITPGGQISGDCFPGAFPTGSEPRSIAYGSDNALWFIAPYAVPSYSEQDLVGRMMTSGTFSYYPPEEQVIRDLTAGPNGTIWFTSEPADLEPGQDHGAVDVITASGIVTRYTLPEGVVPDSIAAGPDGALWFTATGIGSCGFGVGRLAPAGTLTYYDLTDALSGCADPYESTIVAGPDGALWLNAEAGGLIRITTSTPGLSTPMPTAASTAGSSTQVPVTSTVVHPIVVPPDVKRALNRAKLDAEVSKNVVDRVDTGMLVFKLVLAAAEPELAFALLIPDQFDAAEFLADAQLADLAADPPRNDFSQIASPGRIPFVGVTVHASRTQHRARAWRSLISDTESAAMNMRAFTLSVERLQGAAAQGECAWMQRQARAAGRDAKAVRRYLAQEPLDIKLLRRALTAARIHDPSITAAQFRRMQVSVAKKGLPTDVTTSLRRSGLGASEIARVTTLITHAKPRSVHFLEALGQDTRNLSNLSHALDAFASVTAHTIQCMPA